MCESAFRGTDILHAQNYQIRLTVNHLNHTSNNAVAVQYTVYNIRTVHADVMQAILIPYFVNYRQPSLPGGNKMQESENYR